MSTIAITGMHRTGTSMVAKALMLAGLHLGDDRDLVGPAPDNPEGFFEHDGLVRVNEDLLGATGGAWDNPPLCPPLTADDPRVAHLAEPAAELLGALAVQGPWGWKDPRTCLTARFWLDLVPDLLVVICVRHPLEVALSLKRRNRISYSLALRLWHDYYEAILGAIPAERRLVTHYNVHFKDGGGSAERLLSFVGLDRAAVHSAVSAFDERLRHHDLEVTLGAAGASPAVVELYRRLCSEAGLPPEGMSRLDDDADAGRVERAVLDLELARQHLDRRDRRIASLERERDELRARVAVPQSDSTPPAGWSAIADGLNSLEDSFQAVRYELRSAQQPVAANVSAVRELVRAHVPRSVPVVVVCKGDPQLLDLYGRPASTFPQGMDREYAGFWPADGSAAVAHLEALRAEGNGVLLLPEPYRWWLDRYPQLAAHLARYRVLADESGSGLLVDLSARRPAASGWPKDLPGTVDNLIGDAGPSSSVLDWTGREIAEHLRGRNVFRPHGDGPNLPYLDHSVDIVVIDRPDRVEEARRVAAGAVVVLDCADPQLAVEEVITEHDDGAQGEAAVDVVLRTDSPDLGTAAAVREILDAEPLGQLVEAQAEVNVATPFVAFLDPGVVPLPGALAAARRTLARDERLGAVAAKLFGRDGRLVAAGVTVFSDGSWAGVAAGSMDPRSPWHERLRTTNAGIGMVLVRRTALDEIGSPSPGPNGLVDFAGRLWSRCWHVAYQPESAAVRTIGAADGIPEGHVGDAWRPSLQRRPSRPDPLDDTAWQSLLLTDDVAGSWQW
jgi:GT2 family glycosyltransferase